MKLILLSLLLVFLVCMNTYSQESEYIQIKAYNEKIHPLGNINITINSNIGVKIPENGVTYLNLQTKYLPIFAIKLASESKYEVESWTFTKGILEILFRIKKYKKIVGTLNDEEEKPLEGIKLEIKNTDFKSYSDSFGHFGIVVPYDFPLTNNTEFIIDDYNILNKKISGLSVSLVVEKIVVPENDDTSSEEIKTLLPNDIVNKVLEDYKKLDHERKINSTLDSLIADTVRINKLISKVQKESIKIPTQTSNLPREESSKLEDINENSDITDDFNTFLKETQRSNLSRLKEQELINNKMKLINEKLRASGGLKLTQNERNNVLKNIELLEQLLVENKIKYNEAQEDYRVALVTLKNNLENIGILEKQLTEAEVKRNEEREAFIKQLILMIIIIVVAIIIALIALFFARKFKKQGDELTVVNEQIKELNINLENRVEERTRELLETKKELDTFFYKASHDLKRPVTSILGISKIAEMTLKDDGKELFNQTTKTAIEMNKMLEKLIMVGNINMVDKPEIVKTSDLIQKTIDKSEQLCKDYKINIIVQNEIEEIVSHPLLLDNLLVCIVENAIFFTSLSEKKDKQIKINIQKTENSDYTLIIEDNGIGIDEKIYPQIQDMFFVGNTLSKGNGLGLYISSKIIKFMGGKLNISSSINDGCKVDIEIPNLTD